MQVVNVAAKIVGDAKLSRRTLQKLGSSFVSLCKTGLAGKDGAKTTISLKEAFARSAVAANMGRKKTGKVFGMLLSKRFYRMMRRSKKEQGPKFHGGGRKGTGIKVEAIKEIIKDELKETCRFRSDGVPIQSMQRPLKHIFLSNAHLRSLGAYSTLCRALRWGKGGIVSAKKRTDVCIVCYVWDHQARGMVAGNVEEFHEVAEKLMPSYFRTWDRSLQNNDDFTRLDFDRYSSVKYCEALLAFVLKHRGAFVYDRSCLAPDRQEKLAELEDRFCEVFKEESLPIVRDFSVHFGIRNTQWAKLGAHQSNPSAKKVYIMMDYEERKNSTTLFRWCAGANKFQYCKCAILM